MSWKEQRVCQVPCSQCARVDEKLTPEEQRTCLRQLFARDATLSLTTLQLTACSVSVSSQRRNSIESEPKMLVWKTSPRLELATSQPKMHTTASLHPPTHLITYPAPIHSPRCPSSFVIPKATSINTQNAQHHLKQPKTMALSRIKPKTPQITDVSAKAQQRLAGSVMRPAAEGAINTSPFENGTCVELFEPKWAARERHFT